MNWIFGKTPPRDYRGTEQLVQNYKIKEADIKQALGGQNKNTQALNTRKRRKMAVAKIAANMHEKVEGWKRVIKDSKTNATIRSSAAKQYHAYQQNHPITEPPVQELLPNGANFQTKGWYERLTGILAPSYNTDPWAPYFVTLDKYKITKPELNNGLRRVNSEPAGLEVPDANAKHKLVVDQIVEGRRAQMDKLEKKLRSLPKNRDAVVLGNHGHLIKKYEDLRKYPAFQEMKNRYPPARNLYGTGKPLEPNARTNKAPHPVPDFLQNNQRTKESKEAKDLWLKFQMENKNIKNFKAAHPGTNASNIIGAMPRMAEWKKTKLEQELEELVRTHGLTANQISLHVERGNGNTGRLVNRAKAARTLVETVREQQNSIMKAHELRESNLTNVRNTTLVSRWRAIRRAVARKEKSFEGWRKRYENARMKNEAQWDEEDAETLKTYGQFMKASPYFAKMHKQRNAAEKGPNNANKKGSTNNGKATTYRKVAIGADGNCLFAAVVVAWWFKAFEVLPSLQVQKEAAKELRAAAVAFGDRKTPDETSFKEDPNSNTGKLLKGSFQQRKEEYLRKMEKNGTYGTDFEVGVIQRVLGVNIVIKYVTKEKGTLSNWGDWHFPRNSARKSIVLLYDQNALHFDALLDSKGTVERANPEASAAHLKRFKATLKSQFRGGNSAASLHGNKLGSQGNRSSQGSRVDPLSQQRQNINSAFLPSNNQLKNGRSYGNTPANNIYRNSNGSRGSGGSRGSRTYNSNNDEVAGAFGNGASEFTMNAPISEGLKHGNLMRAMGPFRKYTDKFLNRFEGTDNGNSIIKFDDAAAIPKIRLIPFIRVQHNVFGKRDPYRRLCFPEDNNANYKFILAAEATAGCIRGNTIEVSLLDSSNNPYRQTDIELHGRVPKARHVLKASFDKTPMYARLVPFEQEEELVRMQRLTQMVLCNAIPHFPITYGALKCEKGQGCTGGHCARHARSRKGYYIALTEAFHGSLRQWLKSSHPPRAIVSALAQVLMALAVLHGRRIAHGAIDPDNIVFLRFQPKVGDGWWQYRIGDRDVFIRKAGYLFALNNFSKSLTFGGNKQNQPHCEVIALLGMFMPRSNRPLRKMLRALIAFAKKRRHDAAMFLRSPEVLREFQNYASTVVSTTPKATSALDKFDVLPRDYTPYRGKGDCGPNSNGQAQSFDNFMQNMGSLLNFKM